MGITTKVINTIIDGLAIMLVLFMLYATLLVTSLAEVNSMFAVFSSVYETHIFFNLLQIAAISNITTIAFQQIKRATKVKNAIIVIIVLGIMYIGMSTFVSAAEAQALIEGIEDPYNSSFIEQEMTPELSKLVFTGTMVYGMIVIICLKVVMITPFTIKKLPVDELDQQSKNILPGKQVEFKREKHNQNNKSGSPFELE